MARPTYYLDNCSGSLTERTTSVRPRRSVVRTLVSSVSWGHLTAAQALAKPLSAADLAELRRALGRAA